MFRNRILRSALVVATTLWATAACACNVPVFRYALERWTPDRYDVAVFHREPLTAEQQALLDGLKRAGPEGLANLEVNSVLLGGELKEPQQRLWNAQQNATPPWLVLRHPRQKVLAQSIWTGPLNAESIQMLKSSPARRDLAQKLLGGDAVIWLLLESGDEQEDERISQLVETESRHLEQTLVLPQPSPLDPPMTAALPLKIAFSQVRVARSDPAERLLVNMLFAWDPSLAEVKKPMLFPIFGRGRVVPPAVGEEIRAEAMRDMAEFLTGPCSCQIKEMNPGYDLLLTANWDALSGYQEVMLAEAPPLTGLAQFAAQVDNASSAAATQPTAAPLTPKPALATVSDSPPATSRSLARNLVWALGAGVGFLGVATLVVRVRGNRRPR